MRADFVHFLHLHCQWWVKSLSRIGSVFLPYMMKVTVNSHKGYHYLCCAWFTYGKLPMKHLFAGLCISVEYIYILLFVWRFALNKRQKPKLMVWGILQVVVQVVLHLYQDFGVHILIMLSKDVSCSVFLLIDLSGPDVLYKGEVSLW